MVGLHGEALVKEGGHRGLNGLLGEVGLVSELVDGLGLPGPEGRRMCVKMGGAALRVCGGGNEGWVEGGGAAGGALRGACLLLVSSNPAGAAAFC